MFNINRRARYTVHAEQRSIVLPSLIYVRINVGTVSTSNVHISSENVEHFQRETNTWKTESV